MAHVGALPKIHRYITSHNDEGKAIFSSAFDDESKMKPNSDGIAFALSYITKGFPVDMNKDKDLGVYGDYLNDAPGLVVSGGTVLRHVDIPPATECTMHRTVSLDYGCVLEGEIECLLDSGEKRFMKRGDVAIQRGTMHQWINHSPTEWCRMLFVLQECQSLKLGGRQSERSWLVWRACGLLIKISSFVVRVRLKLGYGVWIRNRGYIAIDID